ncbi:hypothetical protein K4F52_008591 [Lecanicillium sp. MT-2017a]|nr:hypothetical protein K4F52_008591 [Lecanicillium sp. MT-2017a]
MKITLLTLAAFVALASAVPTPAGTTVTTKREPVPAEYAGQYGYKFDQEVVDDDADTTPIKKRAEYAGQYGYKFDQEVVDDDADTTPIKKRAEYAGQYGYKFDQEVVDDEVDTTPI